MDEGVTKNFLGKIINYKEIGWGGALHVFVGLVENGIGASNL